MHYYIRYLYHLVNQYRFLYIEDVYLQILLFKVLTNLLASVDVLPSRVKYISALLSYSYVFIDLL